MCETLKASYEKGRKMLGQAGIAEADLDAWYLLEYTTGVSKARYYMDPEKSMSRDLSEKYMQYISLRQKRIPLQHITGEQEFMGLSFEVDEHVLVPRQDTEILVETALELLEKQAQIPDGERIRILDMCTGSGCILLSVLRYAKTPMEGTGADLSGEALKVARRNADKLGQAAEFIRSDLFEGISGKYRMILSNPPYIRTEEIGKLQDEVRLYDPPGALDGGEDGLAFYRRISGESRKFLEPGGVLAFEIGYDQAEAVTEIMEADGFHDIAVRKDLAGLDRVVYGMI